MICSNNPAFAGKGTRKNEDDYTAAPNIDHSQERVRKDIVQWLLYLKNRVGFDGWRFDFVKGYSGVHTREYIDGTVPSLAFGEYWDTMSYADGVLSYNQDAHRQRTVNWCDKTGGTAAAFDFTTKGILQEAVSRREYWRLVDTQGRPPGLIGMWPSRAVTFIEVRNALLFVCFVFPHMRVLALFPSPLSLPALSGRVSSYMAKEPTPFTCTALHCTTEPRHGLHAAALALPLAARAGGLRLHHHAPRHALHLLGPLRVRPRHPKVHHGPRGPPEEDGDQLPLKDQGADVNGFGTACCLECVLALRRLCLTACFVSPA